MGQLGRLEFQRPGNRLLGRNAECEKRKVYDGHDVYDKPCRENKLTCSYNETAVNMNGDYFTLKCHT